MKQFGNVLPNGLKVTFLAHLFYLFSQCKEIYKKSITQGIYKAKEGKERGHVAREVIFRAREKYGKHLENEARCLGRQQRYLASHTLPRVKMFKSGSVVGLR